MNFRGLGWYALLVDGKQPRAGGTQLSDQRIGRAGGMKQAHPISILRAIVVAPSYVIFLTLSTIFAAAYAILCAVIARRAESDELRQPGMRTPPKYLMILLDGVTVIAAYLLADFLRVTFRQHTQWPEHLEGYGSTLMTHLAVMAILPICWTIILGWLGWYRPIARTFRWRANNTVAGTILLGLTLASAALLFARDVYPRAQIGYFLVVLPFVTALVRALIDYVVRKSNGSDNGHGELGPAW